MKTAEPTKPYVQCQAAIAKFKNKHSATVYCCKLDTDHSGDHRTENKWVWPNHERKIAELLESLKAVLQSVDCTHVHTQDCDSTCRFTKARAAISKAENTL